MSTVKCTCCARQIVKYDTDSERTTGPACSAIKDVDGFICPNCAKDLDEYGMFPEEWASVPIWDRPMHK